MGFPGVAAQAATNPTDRIAGLLNRNCGVILLGCGRLQAFLAAIKRHGYCLMWAFFDPTKPPATAAP